MSVVLPNNLKAQTLFLVEELLKTVAYIHMKADDIAGVKSHLAGMLQDKRDMIVLCEVGTHESGRTEMRLVFDFKETIIQPEGLKQ